jgi:hypothetical protein
VPAEVYQEKIKKHSPGAATLMSTLLPGLGQIYNKKYWKPPIIYAAGGAIYYFFDYNNTRYHRYRKAFNQYIADMDGDGQPDNSLDNIENDAVRNLMQQSTDPETSISLYRNYYRRNRDLNIILMSGLYVLNIIDAMVDAHFYSFDVSDDLSMRVEPSLNYQNYATGTMGMSLCFTF